MPDLIFKREVLLEEPRSYHSQGDCGVEEGGRREHMLRKERNENGAGNKNFTSADKSLIEVKMYC